MTAQLHLMEVEGRTLSLHQSELHWLEFSAELYSFLGPLLWWWNLQKFEQIDIYLIDELRSLKKHDFQLIKYQLDGVSLCLSYRCLLSFLINQVVITGGCAEVVS